MFRYWTNCVGSGDGEAISDMVAAARFITRATFLKHVDRNDLTVLEQSLCYDTGNERGGLRMSKDWHVSYSRSTYQGVPCVYFTHSAIEYIFT